jgi:hypothetical protein
MRWWDGVMWTEHVQSTNTATTSTQELTGSNLYRPARDLAGGKNSAATSSLISGIVSLVINPFLVVGIGALIWGSIGLARANRWSRQGHEPVGRVKAIWGIVLAAISTVYSTFLTVALFSGGLFGVGNVQLDEPRVEEQIRSELSTQLGVEVEEVDCPSDPSMQVGSSFRCLATGADGSTAFVTVSVQDKNGFITWELE